MENDSADTTVTEESTSENKSAADASIAMEGAEEEIQFTITAETFADSVQDDTITEDKEAENGAGESGSTVAGEIDETDVVNQTEDNTGDNMDTQKFASIARSLEEELNTYSFRDIFIPFPEQAEYITITDNQGNVAITLTQLEDIQAFYVIMDRHQFTGTGTDSLIDPDYTVEMNSPQLGTLYTMLVGSNLTMRYTRGEDIEERTFFAVEDVEFKQELEEFLMDYSE